MKLCSLIVVRSVELTHVCENILMLQCMFLVQVLDHLKDNNEPLNL
jgi:hypothetical protein